MDEQPGVHLPRPRAQPPEQARWSSPVREARRPAVRLFDVSGLLVVLGLVVAGFLLALVLAHRGF